MQNGPPRRPPVPPEVLAASREAFELHDPSLPVAHLVVDSLLDPQVRRADGVDRRMIFTLGDLSIDVSVREHPGAISLHVQLRHDCVQDPGGPQEEPAEYTVVEVVRHDGRTAVAITDGAADPAGLQPGLTCLVLPCAPDAGTALRTAWFTL